MAVLIVPPLDLSYPTLGPVLKDFIEERFVFGPGSLSGRPARLDSEKYAALCRLYEVYPKGHRFEGRRRFQRGGIEWRKGMAKTEFAAWVMGCELHPDAPVRGYFEGDTLRGRPVEFPYIPMMAASKEQVEELAFGVLKYVIGEGPDADLFDITDERVMRLGRFGQDDGKAVPVAGAPGSRDGALTTCMHFDEPHRLKLPTHKHAYETMMANLSKRPLEDPWAFHTSTAGAPGENSVEEDLRAEAEAIDRGEIEDPALFFFARWADTSRHAELDTREQRVAAIAEATGPVGEYGPGQFENIAKHWERPKADKAYLERVWLNRWRQSGSTFFDRRRIDELLVPGEMIPAGAFVTLGFDGARFRDATAIVATEITTGLQELIGLWERPDDADEWEVPEDEVTATFEDAMRRYRVWKLYADPPHWTETIGAWFAKYPGHVEEWYTKRHGQMAYVLREYQEAIDAGTIRFGGRVNPDFVIGRTLSPHDDLVRHLGNAGKKELRLRDDNGEPLYVMQKQDGQMGLKFDAAMAAVLSWKARLDALKGGAKPVQKRRSVIRRIGA